MQSIDPFGLDGLWWHYHSALRPDETLPSTFYALTGAMKLAAQIEDTRFLVMPGPEAPFVIPRLLDHEGAVAVVSHVKVGAHEGFPIFYFANPLPTGLRFNTWGRGLYYVEENGERLWNKVPEDEEPLDFELAPWIERGKLLWIKPGDAKLALENKTKGCPFLGLAGRREFLQVQHGAAVGS
jgi:hypothetical protein